MHRVINASHKAGLMIPVEHLVKHAAEFREHFGRPLITVSYAQSIDGSIAAQRGQGLKLSGQESLTLSHSVRAHHDALLVGIGTILSDDPHLNVRHVKGKDPQPIILDSRLRFPPNAQSLNNRLLPWIFTTEGASREKEKQLEKKGIHVLYVKSNEQGSVDLYDVLKHLLRFNMKSLLVEGGARIINSFFSEGLVDQFVITITPVFIGGLHALEKLLLPEIYKKADRKDFPAVHLSGTERLGEDLIVWGTVVRK